MRNYLKTLSWLLCFHVLLATTNVARPEEHPAPATEPSSKLEFSERILMSHVKFLCAGEMQGRKAGSQFERIAARYITTRLEAAEVAPLASGLRRQTFKLQRIGGPVLESLNILGFIEGAKPELKDEVVVLGAHMDHLGGSPESYYPGAEDNATGVAVVLEIARALQMNVSDLGRSILIIFFGCEEMGCMGSGYFVRNPPMPLEKIVTMVNIDMIGRPLADQKALVPLKKLFGIDDMNSLGVVGALGRPSYCSVVDAACAQAGIKPFGTKNIRVISSVVEGMAKNRGDQAPFEDRGIPTLFFGSGESDDYHKKTDTVDKIRPALLARRAKAVYLAVLSLSNVPRAKLPPRKAEAAPPAKDSK